MNYLTYGDKNNKSIVLIHGMATTAKMCYERILPFLTKMGPILTKLYMFIFWSAISWLIKGHSVPKFMMDIMMGKDNSAVIDMLYMGVKKKTIYNVCQYVYTYSVPEKVKEFSGKVLFIYGSNEPYPRKSVALLKKNFPGLQTKEIDGMGHGQYIMVNSKAYAEELLSFLQ